DPTNSRHMALLQRAANAGIEVDADEWNNTASNLAPVDVIDPQNPTQKRRQYFNKATGQLTDVAPTGYVQPVDAKTGMTSFQSGSLGERTRHDKAAEAQGQERIRQARQFGIARLEQGDIRLAQSADRATRTRYNQLSTLIQQRNDHQAKANRWRSYKGEDGALQPWAEKRAQQEEDQIRSIEDRVQSQYGDLLDEAAASDDGMITGAQKAMENRNLTRTPRSSIRARAAAQPKGRVSRAKFRE